VTRLVQKLVTAANSVTPLTLMPVLPTTMVVVVLQLLLLLVHYAAVMQRRHLLVAAQVRIALLQCSSSNQGTIDSMTEKKTNECQDSY